MKTLLSLAAAAVLWPALAHVHVPDRCRPLYVAAVPIAKEKLNLMKQIKDLQFRGALLLLLMGKGANPKQKDVSDVLLPYAKWIASYVKVDGEAAEAMQKAHDCTNE